MTRTKYALKKGETRTEGVDIKVQLLDPNGAPACNDMALDASVKNGQHSWGRSGVHIQSDENGRFVFKNVNPGPGGTCAIRVIGGKGYRPVCQEIRNFRSPVVIRLEKGRRATGVVIDDATGWPVPGVQICAQSTDGPQGNYTRDFEQVEADGRTNAQGRFVFSNMKADYYRLMARSVSVKDSRHPIVVVGGQEESATIRITIPEWSDLKPRKPLTEP